MDKLEKIDVGLPHHVKKELCTTRAPYRQGRKLTSVKLSQVYTINNESQHLLIHNVPAIGIDTELHTLCERFGEVLCCKQAVSTENIEEFTNVFHIHYATLKSSRYAKRNLDNKSFFGAILHVCYAPEFETMEETKNKLSTRRKEVSFHLKQLEFPKQFRYQGGNKAKRQKIGHFSTKPIDFQPKYFQNYHIPSQINQPVTSDPIPGPSKVEVQEKPILNMEPFKKLVPTKVSRIVFHNRSQNNDNNEHLIGPKNR